MPIGGQEHITPHPHESLVADVLKCSSCRLCLSGGSRAVHRGPVGARMMLVGEAPGEVEARRGLPFVGSSGMLLSRLLNRAGIPEESIYITNLVKCRPPQNRNPSDDELRECRRFLLRQLDLVRPRVIVTAGRIATMAMTATKGPMNVLPEEEGLTCFLSGDTPVIPIYHPAYLIRRMGDQAARDVFRDTLRRLQQAWQKASE